MDIKSYLPQYLQDNELFLKIGELLDYLLEQEIEFGISYGYLKYDWEKAKKDQLELVINEAGQEYIREILALTEDEIKTLFQYVFLVRYLKGTRTGLELVLKLLNINATITEWFEKDPQGETLTFDLDINLNMSSVSLNLLDNLIRFFRSYVYPKLANLTISYYADFARLGLPLGGFEYKDFLVEFGNTSLNWRCRGVTVRYYDATFEGTL